METIDKAYWDSRWQSNEIGWDTGAITTPLKNYFDQLSNKQIKILIPGCGNGHEAEYLHQHDFTNVFVIDISALALASFANRVPQFPKENLIEGDFFEHQQQYDLIVEQTFFCALNPALRASYAKKMHELLYNGGKLTGLLFNAPLYTEHPPFGGNKEEYLKYFEPYFTIKYFDESYNSIKPRANRELFIQLVKKDL